jgi:steroid 5-alpha reductase family enzyme
MNALNVLIYTFLISLVITLTGFKKTVWFISIGYTFSIVASSVFVLVFKNSSLDVFNYLQAILLMIWGIRLGFYIIKRESDTNYNSSVKDQISSSQELPWTAKAGIWISVSFLYVCMFSPAVFTLQDKTDSPVMILTLFIAGVSVMGTGVILEAIADNQKSVYKKGNPKSYCNTGLYKWVRCPNYFGEIMVWTGNFICAVPFISGWWQWAIASTGLICIVLIMMGSAKRLEKKQSERYGSETDFQKYEKTVPILFPWIRLYSLQKIKVYLE